MIEALQGVRVLAIAAGGVHSLALSEGGEVYSCGLGYFGQLGHGDTAKQRTPRPIAVLQGVRVGAVAAGGRHSLAVSTAGRLYSFGRGAAGQLGHGDTECQYTPLLVAALLDVRVSTVAAGADHSLALSAGKIYSFGSGEHGRLGHGNTAARLTPHVIAGLQGVRVCAVAVGHHTSLAITTDREAHGWGCGDDHPVGGLPNPVLGLELTGDQLVPRKYAGLCLHT